MTVSAYDERFPLPCGHTADPWGFLCSPFNFEVCEFANVVHFAVPLGSAQFAGVRQEPFDKLVATAVKAEREAVVEDCMLVSSERDTTEVGDQWFFVLAAINRDFEAFHRPVGGMHRGAVGVQHGAPACFMLIRQGADERLLHEPVQSAEVRDVGGQQVVLHHTPILRLVPLDDGVVVLEEQCRSMGGFAVLHILRAMGINDRRWDAESNAAVHTSLALPGIFSGYV